jgi:hypothetical protein
MRHFLLAIVYALCISVFFASLLRHDRRSMLRFFASLFGIMVSSVFVLGWLMALIGR